jgi:hypothetical protein
MRHLLKASGSGALSHLPRSRQSTLRKTFPKASPSERKPMCILDLSVTLQRFLPRYFTAPRWRLKARSPSAPRDRGDGDRTNAVVPHRAATPLAGGPLTGLGSVMTPSLPTLLTTGFLLGWSVAWPPGPIDAEIARRCAAGDLRAGMAVLFGASSADAVWAIAVALMSGRAGIVASSK